MTRFDLSGGWNCLGIAARLGAVLALWAAGLACRGPAGDRPAGPGAAPAAPASAYEAQLARELSERAGAFLRGTLAGLAPGAAGEKAAADAQYAIGDLFKCGREVAVVAFLAWEKEPDGRRGDARSPGLAFYERKGRQWQLRDSFAAEGSPLEGRVFELKDLSGDGVPEVLFLESFGATGNQYWTVYKYDRARDRLVLSAESLGRPRWDGREVRTFGVFGAAGFDNHCEGHRWAGDRLVRQWSCTQQFVPWTFLVGLGEPAVRVEYEEFGATEQPVYAWKAIGNLASYRNLVGEGLPARLVADVEVGGKRRAVLVEPDLAKVRAAGLADEFVALVSEAVYGRPEKFSADAQVTAEGGRRIRLADFARIAVVEDARGPAAYECHDLDARARKECGRVPPGPAAYAGTRREAVRWWATAFALAVTRSSAARPAPLPADADVWLFVRGPAFAMRGYAEPGLQFVIRSARFAGEKLQVECEILGPGPDKTAAEGTVTPVVMLNLGRLAPDRYRAEVTVTGPGVRENFGTAFRVEGRR